MMLSEGLRRARELYVNGDRRLVFPEWFEEAKGKRDAVVVDYMGMMLEATEDNIDLACDLLAALDEEAPGKSFGFWADGGRWVQDQPDPVYHYDTKPADIAAVFGKAIQRAQQREGA
jgi:hypothetical protein